MISQEEMWGNLRIRMLLQREMTIF
ncbi:hypothetical protein XAC3612_3080001 [Xanthomonas citri pv. citri]|nr:hypothetical protein XAC3612_3080001 [Xanthomonas citri pv. citri]